MRTIPTRAAVLSTVCLFGFWISVGSAVRAQQPCTVSLGLSIATAPHIFTVQQERTLGDIEAGWVESSHPAADDEKLAEHLNAVAGRILSQFPEEQTGIRVVLIDTPEAESFSIGPERIYVTRKMVASLRNDDELAGLIGHELGHILAHKNAVIVSQLFQEILGVNTVTDKKDIVEKLRRLFDSIDQDRKSLRKAGQIIENQEGLHQQEADRIALYASAAAGFSPQAYLDLFDRLAGTNGNTGGVLTDFFAAPDSDLRRFREMKKMLKQLPRPCREIAPTDSAQFRSWQAAVISRSDLARR
jgi:predicted Zn-dependent protease